MVKLFEQVAGGMCTPVKKKVLVDRVPYTVCTKDGPDEREGNSLASILSAETAEFSSEESSLPAREELGTWDQKWSNIQEQFSRRDRILERMSRTTNLALMDLIRRREMLVRRQKTELLVLQHFVVEMPGHNDGKEAVDRVIASNETDSDDGKDAVDRLIACSETESDTEWESDDDAAVWHDARGSPDNASYLYETVAGDTKSDNTFLHRIYDVAMFEWYTTAPGIFSCGLHCLAHASLYDVIEIVFNEFRKYAERNITWVSAHTLSLFVTLVFGLALVRSSGYLYWWLNVSDYNCIKFDYHNRLRLNHWDARYLLWIKRRPILQATMFITGYHLCYKVVFHLYEQFYYFFFNQGDQTSYWSSWTEQVYGQMEYPLPLPVLMLLFCTCVCIASIWLLKWYGFAVFSKY
jgi:hypothetical protein